MLGRETKKNIFCEKALPGAVASDLTQTRSKKNQAKELEGAKAGCQRHGSWGSASARPLGLSLGPPVEQDRGDWGSQGLSV